MTIFLMTQDLWDIVGKGYVALPNCASILAEQLRKDTIALCAIQ